jgi:hypothetical protein
MDYGKWVERLDRFVPALRVRSPAAQGESFAVEIGSPLDEGDLEELAESLDCGLPPPLRRFLSTGASAISFRYAWPTAQDETEEVFCPAD